MSSRRGVSLMEVLVSIGVVAVGLMGVASLIPLAFQQAESGARNERKASLSKRAFREFHVLGMANPQRWASPNVWYAQGTVGVGGLEFHSPGIRSAFCIDPRWVANNVFDPANPTMLKNQNQLLYHNSLPALPGPNHSTPVSETDADLLWRGQYTPLMDNGVGPAIMPRVSLRPIPGVESLMTFLHADEVFNAQDDLVFEFPKQQTLPPVQTSMPKLGVPIKRNVEGSFSWFATVVPDDGMTDMYKLSVAVCYQRDLNAPEIIVPVSMNYNSMVVDSNTEFVGDMQGVGFAGGDMGVNISLTGELKVKPGEYVMLSRHIAADVIGGQTIFKQRFQWYRVVSVENNLAQNTAFVTLNGADWDFRPVPGANGDIPNQITYMTYIPGITSVFEKTIRLERTSLWN